MTLRKRRCWFARFMPKQPDCYSSKPIQRGFMMVTVVGFFLSMTVPLRSQGPDFSQLLSGDLHPLSIQLKDADSHWRRISLSSHGNISDNVSINVNVSGEASSSISQNTLMGALTSGKTFLTKGQTVSAAGRSYLVAYHLPASPLDLGALLQSLATKMPPSAPVLTGETVLPLALLDVQSIGSLLEVRPFDLKNEIAESERLAHALTDLVKKQTGGGSTNAPPPANAESEK